MRENNEKNSRKRLNALILLVAFTAVLLIVSTYAWFSTQKNVTLSNLDGTVKVAEGLQVSLDADNWSNSIDFSTFTPQTALKQQYTTTDHNLIPTEMLPVSTTATENLDKTGTGTGIKELSFYRGTNIDSIKLYDIKAVSNDLTKIDKTGESLAEGTDKITAAGSPDIYPGYYAIDFFLQNSSAETTGTDVLQLNTGSLVNVKAGGNNSVGLQNTPRVALALYNEDSTKLGEKNDGTTVGQATKDTILAATTGEKSTIKDVAIWEPNANAHVDYIVKNNNYNETAYTADKAAVNGWKLSDADYKAYQFESSVYKYSGTQVIPTYALNSKVTSADDSITVDSKTTKTGYKNLYDWTGTYKDKGMAKQITLQTPSSTTGTSAVKNLISATSTEASVAPNATGTDGIVNFEIPKGKICRMRMYVWLEGQDVDCINYASHGGGVSVNLGLIKGAALQ